MKKGRVTNHAFLLLFSIIVSFIILTAITSSVASAWASVFWGIVGWGVLLLITRFINRDFIKAQKKLNKQGWYIADNDLIVTGPRGNTPKPTDRTYLIHYAGQTYHVDGIRTITIAGQKVREISEVLQGRACLLFCKDGNIDVFVAIRSNATLTNK